MASCRIILIESANATEAAAELLKALSHLDLQITVKSAVKPALSEGAGPGTPAIQNAPTSPSGRNIRTHHLLTCDQKSGWTGSYRDAAMIIQVAWQSVYLAVQQNRPCKGYRFRRVGEPATPVKPALKPAVYDGAGPGTPAVQKPKASPAPPIPKAILYKQCTNCGWKIKLADFLPGYCVKCRHHGWREVQL